MKALGSDIKEFYREGWPGENFTHVDYDETIWKDFNKAYDFSFGDEDLVELGRLGWITDTNSDKVSRFATHFNRWMDKRHNVTICIKVPKTREAEAKALLYAHGFMDKD